MGYRDMSDGLRLRAEGLEQELAAGRVREALLRGDDERDVVLAPNHAWLGMPLKLRMRQELPFRVTPEGLEAIAMLMNRRLPNASLDQRPSGIVQRQLWHELAVRQEGEANTTMTLAVDFKIGVRMALLIGPAVVAAASYLLVMSPTAAVPSVLLLTGLIFIAVSALAARVILCWQTRNRRRSAMALFAVTAAVAEEHRTLW